MFQWMNKKNNKVKYNRFVNKKCELVGTKWFSGSKAWEFQKRS